MVPSLRAQSRWHETKTRRSVDERARVRAGNNEPERKRRHSAEPKSQEPRAAAEEEFVFLKEQNKRGSDRAS